ncbi:MAG TPA: SGNH/GDSL hydrolase family protein, partial [Candidatus Polarisedimenticolia bacterium]|nr:SGNH/GDSL hydrolase family protein [Candidatus Polarisedimenticolia bacterium]
MTRSDDVGNRQAQRPASRRRLHGALLNLLLMLTSIAIILGLCEIGLRLFYPAGSQPKINDFDPLLGHRMKPNVDLVHVWPAHENVSTIRTNSAGFRGPELPGEKQPGEFRILLLGDSYTFGFGVGDEDTFAHRLQEMIDSRAGAAGRVSVINAGVSAYGTAQQLLLYESAHAKFAPDLVVLNFFVGNDVQENLCLAVPRL